MNHLIQIRGTSGSGKSTAMKRMMDLYRLVKGKRWQAIYQDAKKKPFRKQPIYYELDGVCVLGHYEGPGGGCDLLGADRSVARTLALAKLLFARGAKCVVMEGLLHSADVVNTVAAADPHHRLTRILWLNTPLEVCIERIEARRKAKGNDKPLSVAKTTVRFTEIARARERLQGLPGIDCRTATCDQVPALVVSWLKNL